MKKSQLNALVREIVRQFTEMNTQGADWSVSGDTATLENVDLDDGRLAGGEFSLDIAKTNSGIGKYEFWGHKYNDRGTDSYMVEGGTLTHAWIHDENGKIVQDVPLNDPASKPVIDALESAFESNQEAISTYVQENPPEPYHPGED